MSDVPERHLIGRWRPRDGSGTVPLDTSIEIQPNAKREIHDAENLLLDALVLAPYFVLQDQRKTFDLVVGDIRQRWTQERDEGYFRIRRRITTALENWLSSFRAFDDKTSAELSKKYGKESAEYRIFKKALSEEYDNQVAYRISVGLRNFYQHEGSALTLVVDEKLNDDGTHDLEFRIFILPEELLAWDGWNQVARTDLQKMSGVISVTHLIDTVEDCCKRAFANATLAQMDHLKSAAETLAQLDTLGPQPANGRLTILTLPVPHNGLKGSSWSDIQMGLVDGLANLEQELQHVVQRYGRIKLDDQ